MPSPTIADIKHHADIRHVWAALGGGKLRGSRGQAFWRDGDGYSIALDPAKGCWFDHRDGQGGDVIALVQRARGCDFRGAVEWLADFAGIPRDEAKSPRARGEIDASWAEDLRRAEYWKMAVVPMAEWALEEMPSWDMRRSIPTALLAALRLGDGALVSEYRGWRRRVPEVTAAMVHAGILRDARIQRRLARSLRRYWDA